jgi:type I restriction enzyme M protein
MMSPSEQKINEVGRRAQENAKLIWNAANSLFGAFKPHEYGLVILPMCVIKRFHDCLLPTHDAVLEANKQYESFGELKVGFLKEAAGYQFYNTSKFTFSRLITDPENIEDNFRDYLAGFSDNVQQILSRMNFHAQIDRMAEAGVLYQVIVDFSAKDLDMSPKHISTVDMGYIFEKLVQWFSESYNEEAGAHFTSRDIIYLMCDLLLTNNDIVKDVDGIHCTVYDMTMGTSQMLTCMEERLKQLDSKATVQTFGQEINPFTMGIAVADTMIHGGDPDNMQFGDTLSDDKFTGYQFDFVISNPPFGIDWKREATVVEAEHKKGEAGRFAPGLPSKSDGQMLFLMNGVKKLKDTGRMAIIQNGSSLFTGDAESGQSEIRRYLIENDWLDAIVQLPNDSFYNTGIVTYIWIISKDKPEDRKGKVQLIDASKCCQSRRKPIGNKRVDIAERCRAMIVQAYGENRSKTYEGAEEDGKSIICKSKVLNGISLGYRKVVVETPIYNEDGTLVLKRGKKVADTAKRDSENIPLTEDVEEYISREVLPYNPDAWVDEGKTKIGYEIPFTRTFYEYKKIEPADQIAQRIEAHEHALMEKLYELFGKAGE